MNAVFLASAVVAVIGMLVLWAVSVRLRDASIVDVFWGPGFAAVAWTSLLVAGPSPRGFLLASLATAWGLRLATHIARRRRGQGEDRRYAEMRASHGARFALVSLFTVFLLQAGLMWLVSLPLQAGAALRRDAAPGAAEALGLAVFAIGFAFEAVADAQLRRFLARPSSHGRVMQDGLWRYTRHPNYFGDSLVWWGLGIVALASGAWWALAGPAVMTVLLVRISGVALLEKTIGERRPGYAAYAARTSAFLPLPPRRSSRA